VKNVEAVLIIIDYSALKIVEQVFRPGKFTVQDLD
jgi:hypothetical protein